MNACNECDLDAENFCLDSLKERKAIKEKFLSLFMYTSPLNGDTKFQISGK